MTRQSVSKHLAILEDANLITTVRRGREKLHFLNAEPINALSERWIRKYDRERIAALTDLTSAWESTPMNDTEFVYTTYIEAPPELVTAIGASAEFGEQARLEPRSTATFDLSRDGTQMRLTVTHSGFRPGSVVLPDISTGWPKVLSWLKTFLESGRWQEAA